MDGKEKTKGQENKGQEKVHTATRTLPDGTVETKDFTQAQWRDRDKTAGWTREDGIEDDIEEGSA